MNRVGSETHRPVRRSIGMTRRTRRAVAVVTIAAAAVLTVQADTAGAASCSLRVVAVTTDSMTLAYEPHDGHARTVWVDGQPTTIAPHTTAVVRRADTIEYPTLGEVVVVADIDVSNPLSPCSTATTQPTTTTTSSTTSTVPTTTSTSALTTITVVRTTPEPTTSTAPLPPATWTVIEPTTTTTPGKRTTLPETGGGDTAATLGLLLWFGGIICLVLAAAVLDQIRRKDEGR